MVARKCQAENPVKCRDKKCPNRVKHLVHTRDVLFSMENLYKTSLSENILEEAYFEALVYDLKNNNSVLFHDSDKIFAHKILQIDSKIDAIEDSFLNKYYETGHHKEMDSKSLERINALTEEKRKMSEQRHSLLISYLSQYEGNSRLKEEIRELKNKYPKPKLEISNKLKLLHEADIYHRKQIIAALLLDEVKRDSKEEYSLNILSDGVPTNYIKLYNSWVEKVGKEYDKKTVRGFQLKVDRFGLDVNGEWWLVEPDENGSNTTKVIVPEKFTTIFPQVPDLTLFKETVINQMIVLRRKAKRKIISTSEVDMLKNLEYNSRKIAELKQL
jgi:hypothetical protein